MKTICTIFNYIYLHILRSVEALQHSSAHARGHAKHNSHSGPFLRVWSSESESTETTSRQQSGERVEQGNLAQLKGSSSDAPKPVSAHQGQSIHSPGQQQRYITPLSLDQDATAETDTDYDSCQSSMAMQSGQLLFQQSVCQGGEAGDETDTDVSIATLEPNRTSVSKSNVTGRTVFINSTLAEEEEEEEYDEYEPEDHYNGLAGIGSEDSAVARAIRTDTPPPRSSPFDFRNESNVNDEHNGEEENYLLIEDGTHKPSFSLEAKSFSIDAHHPGGKNSTTLSFGDDYTSSLHSNRVGEEDSVTPEGEHKPYLACLVAYYEYHLLLVRLCVWYVVKHK